MAGGKGQKAEGREQRSDSKKNIKRESSPNKWQLFEIKIVSTQNIYVLWGR